MSDILHNPEASAVREEHPDAAGGGGAQRREPERSDGSRSGAHPPPAASPPTALPVLPASDVTLKREPILCEASAELPLPVCPVGEVIGLGTEAAHAEPPGPGASPLDEGLRQLRNEFAGEQGGEA